MTAKPKPRLLVMRLADMQRVHPHQITSHKFYLGEIERNHFWLKLKDGRALDPTIDQFKTYDGWRLPPVYLGPPLPTIHREATDHVRVARNG
jgi:hypothetical protein